MANKKEMATPNVSVSTDTEQPIQKCTDHSISDYDENINSFEEMQREMLRQLDPSYLKTVSMATLYDTVFDIQPPLIDGLLQRGTYLFVGSPKVGKSFMMAQLAYHISIGMPLWEYKVRKATVLYFALEDDYPRLQKRLFQMFGVEETGNLYFATECKTVKISGTNGLMGAADGAFVLSKEKRISNNATLDVAGRDQQDMKVHLVRDTERLVWNFEKSETELWKEPPEPLLEKIAATLFSESDRWEGTASELCERLGVDIKPNVLSLRLSINASKLFRDYGIRYQNSRTHNGRKVSLWKETDEAV